MQTLSFGRFEVRPTERRLLIDQQAVTIGARAFDVLLTLIERRGRAVTKSELLDAVWPHLVVEENNLHVHISALRKLLGADVIATIPGLGYRFAVLLDCELTAAAVPEAARHNLPEKLPALYGREQDLQSLLALIRQHALVTIVGAGGIGKTRLAMAAAHELRNAYPHGAWAVEMAAINDPSHVLPTIAKSLQITLPGNSSARQELITALKSQTLLLVLDNCEHVLDVVSDLACGLLHEAPGVRLLATSQELLRVHGEQLFRLSPLAVPTLGQADHAADFGAVQLFVERVRALDASFELNADNTSAIIDICGRLDGIALALELAAARVPLLGITGMRERLSERFHMLTGGARVSLRRHQTLRAALDWSHNLLAAKEQKVFRRLGVFSGGFTLDNAQRVVTDDQLDEWAVIDQLSALADKSLLMVEVGPRPRYRMLETARSYAVEKLAEAGETDTLLRRHALATQAVMTRAVKRRDMALLAQEMNNVRAAFAWAIGPHGDAPIAVALATASSVVLAVEGFVVEALDRLLRVEPLVNDATPPPLAAQYWQWLGRHGVDGRLPVSRCIDAFLRSESMFRQQGNARHLHACLRMRAEAMLETTDMADAQAALDEAERMEGAGWPVADRMRRLRVQGMLLAATNQPEKALATFEMAYQLAESASIDRYVLNLLSDMAGTHLTMGHADTAAQQFLALARMARMRPTGGLTLCYALSGLTAALIASNRLDQARQVAAEAIPLLRRSGIFISRSDIFAWLLAREHHFPAAARLLGASDALRERCESSRGTIERHVRAETQSLLQAAHPDRTIRDWMAEGALASEDELAELVLETTPPARLKPAAL
ncbi:MAG: winged helix-turn-helix domain-containing protein [Aquabacterium sp.]|uniref:ATP-binding protein n=1 Tax=Aquabacterium sp. TaxID=1872578 RepID=UPI0027220AF4|nr:winged helix-turn-helix domain-containing protein [Aquabacterium sp.]MDO9003782.1 winged helix-turn-helix domain-containing protein [Aquabacterium sp.]